MIDYSKLSDEELLALKNKDYSKLSDETLLALKSSNQAKKEGALSKLNRGAFNVASGALETVNAPFELAGEALRMPIEGDSNFRAPSIVQRLGLGEKTALPPENPFSLTNKLLRAGAAGGQALLRGQENAAGTARQAYNADRGATGAVEDAALAALTGKLAPKVANAPVDAAAKIPGAILKGGKEVVKSVGKKALRTLGPTEEALSLRYNRPQDLAAAKNIDDLSADFAKNVDNLRDQVRALDDEAWGTLLKLKAEPKSKIINILKGIRRELVGKGGSKIGDSDKAAVAKFDEYISRVESLKQNGSTKGTEQFLDQEQLRDIVQSIRRDADYSDPKFEPLNNAIKKFAHGVDQQLKNNGNYKEVMAKLAPKTKALNEAISEFKLLKDNETGKFIPSNTTAQKLSLINKEKRPETKRIIGTIKEHTGVDFEDQVRLSKAKEQFKPGAENSRGSARTAAGALAGLILEPFIPGPQGLPTAILGTLGRSADYYGGSAAGKIIDMASRSGTKVGNLLSAANTNPRTSQILELVKQLAQRSPIARPFLLNQ